MNLLLLTQKYIKLYTLSADCNFKKGKGSSCSITERRVLELIPVLGSQAVGYYYFPPGSQLPRQPLSGLLPISLLGEQRHDECEQFA